MHRDRCGKIEAMGDLVRKKKRNLYIDQLTPARQEKDEEMPGGNCAKLRKGRDGYGAGTASPPEEGGDPLPLQGGIGKRTIVPGGRQTWRKRRRELKREEQRRKC